MDKFEMACMQRDASDSPLRRLFRVILAVAHHRVADGRELHADLVLQSGDQRHSHERRGAKAALHHIVKFGTRRLRVCRG